MIMKIIAATCIFILFSFSADLPQASEYYDVQQRRILEVVGRTKEEGMNHAVAAIRLRNYAVLRTPVGLEVDFPVFINENKMKNYYHLDHRFYDCYYLQKLPMGIEIDFMVEDDNLYSANLKYLFANVEPLDFPPDGPTYPTCTWEFAAGYNTVIMNYILLHPDLLENFKRNDEEEESEEQDQSDGQESPASSENQPEQDCSCEERQAARREAGEVSNDDDEIDIIAFPERVFPPLEAFLAETPDIPSSSEDICAESKTVEDIGLLPLRDFLLQHGLL